MKFITIVCRYLFLCQEEQPETLFACGDSNNAEVGAHHIICRTHTSHYDCIVIVFGKTKRF